MQETWIRSLGQEDTLKKEVGSTPVFWRGESHGQSSLAGYSPWGCKESDTTEQLHFISAFVKHGRTRTGEKPNACKECGMTFSSCHQFTVHQSLHTSEKQYECGECGKAFYNSSYLVQHQRTITVRSPMNVRNERKTFIVHENLIWHQSIHTGEKPCL